MDNERKLERPKFKVCLLTASTVGNGHISIHNAIKSKLQESFKDWPIEIQEQEIDHVLGFWGKLLFRFYSFIVEWLPTLYSIFYWFINWTSTNNFMRMQKWIISDEFRHRMAHLDPDMVINTHPTGAAFCSILKQEKYLSSYCSLISFGTDFVTGSAYDSEGLVVVPHQKLKDIMIQDYNRIDREVEVIPGLLPRPEFYQEYSQKTCRLEAYQEIYKETAIFCALKDPMLLAIGGGYGLRLKKLVDFLPSWRPDLPITLVIICGHNKKLLH